MAKPRSQIKHQLALVGNLTARWNDLQDAIRFLAMNIVPDFVTANMLISDMQASQLIATTRMLADEMEHSNNRSNAVWLERLKDGAKVKLYEPMFDHVDFLLTCVDTLREYRNYYVHGAVVPANGPYLTVTIITSRKLSFNQWAVSSEDVEKRISQIEDFTRYTALLMKAIQRNNSKELSERPTWPERPPVPDRLTQHRTSLRGVLSPLLSSDE